MKLVSNGADVEVDDRHAKNALLSLNMLAMADVAPSDSGLASGLVNPTGQLGGALGIAVLATLATSRTDQLLAGGANSVEALLLGFHQS